MGYKKLIRSLIKPAWYEVLKREEAISYFVDTVYESFKDIDTYPPSIKFKRAVKRRVIIEVMLRCSFDAVVIHSNLTEHEKWYWFTLNGKINTFKP